MDVTTNIKSRLPSPHMMEGPERVSRGAPPSTKGVATRRNPARTAEIFKKTPYGTGLKRMSRYVAKDILEVASIPLLKKILLDHGQLHGASLAAVEPMITESSKAVKRNSHQDAIRSASKPITVFGDLVALKGNPAPYLSESQDGGIPPRETDLDALNVKLTDKELAVHTTKKSRRATNHMSGTLWTYARQVGATVGRAVAQPSQAHEKYCNADI